MRTGSGGRVVPALQYAATAFYVVAVSHGFWLHRRSGDEKSDARVRAWTPAYATAMSASFLVGWRCTEPYSADDRRRRVRVTDLLVAFYGLLRTAAARGFFDGDDRHRRGAAAEALALALAYALGYGPRIVRNAVKTQ